MRLAGYRAMHLKKLRQHEKSRKYNALVKAYGKFLKAISDASS
jgi:hypothetical protein